MNVGWQRAKGRLTSVSICSPGPDLIEPWNDLAARLESNAFMHPAALLAATETSFAKIHVLLAWDEETTPRRPIGFWALRERHDLPLMPAFLEALPYDYAFTSNAMIDGACADDVVATFFDAVRRDARLPKIVRLQSFEADPIVHPAIVRNLASTGRYHEFFRTERPFADQFTGTKKSTRKKLRQLSAVGTVEIINERTPARIETAFEIFLKLEAESWKGEEGTALLCDAGDARFSRRLIENLAACGLASVALLRVDGDAIAAQVLLYSGQRAYTWKTAFKASFARFSPGVLVADNATQSLVECGQIATIDSCSFPGGFTDQLFTGRRPFVDALIDLRPRNSLAFAVEVAQHRGYQVFGQVRSGVGHVVRRWRAAAVKNRSPNSQAYTRFARLRKRRDHPSDTT
jgi:CelD/BcsL family acetyltransferase involved in cellulose biosynthesis